VRIGVVYCRSENIARITIRCPDSLACRSKAMEHICVVWVLLNLSSCQLCFIRRVYVLIACWTCVSVGSMHFVLYVYHGVMGCALLLQSLLRPTWIRFGMLPITLASAVLKHISMSLAEGLQMACNCVRCNTCRASMVYYEVVVEVYMLFAFDFGGATCVVCVSMDQLFCDVYHGLLCRATKNRTHLYCGIRHLHGVRV
jgi:hypothetical protein